MDKQLIEKNELNEQFHNILYYKNKKQCNKNYFRIKLSNFDKFLISI